MRSGAVAGSSRPRSCRARRGGGIGRGVTSFPLTVAPLPRYQIVPLAAAFLLGIALAWGALGGPGER